MGLIRFLLCALIWAGSAAADADAIESAWLDWAQGAGVRSSSLAITRDGALVRTRGLGRDARAPAPLASLSKSITGACVMALAERGRLPLDTTTGALLPQTGLRMTPGASRITVRQLLTHSSGLTRDSTQGHPAPWRARGGDRTLAVAQAALNQDPGPRRFAYNNENYAVLGAMIQAATGEPPARLCPRLLGLDARVSADFGGGVSWGGYEMSAPDFARFAATLRPTSDWPRLDLGGGVRYGPGVMFQDGGGPVWHFGSWCFLLGRSAGAYFFQLRDSWGVTVTWDRCLSDRQMLALDAALARAVR